MATSVEAPMVGKILRIEKQVGEHVDEDEVVIVMEAMKMEIPIVAPVAGTLKPTRRSPLSSNPPVKFTTCRATARRSNGHVDIRLDAGADRHGRNHVGPLVIEPAYFADKKNLPL